jgi:hypothetical protein
MENSQEEMSLRRTQAILAKVVGEEKARAVVEECLGEAGLESVSTPQEFLSFGQTLVKRGGFMEVVGRSIMARALIAGAQLKR